MATAVAPSFHSTKETTNYARLCRLLVDVGSDVLRETFEKKRPPGNLDTVLSSPPVHAVLLSLKKKKLLNPQQWDKLYPVLRSSVSSKNFDTTLLMVLLRNICGLVPPSTGWNTLPPAADTTLDADIVRIKYYRNTVYGHASEASVDGATFNQYWQDIQGPLVRLGGGGYQAAIDDLKTECMDPDFEEHYKELLRQVVMDEVSIKERLDVMRKEMGQIGRSLDEFKEAIVNPIKKAGDKAVTEYSIALKESIRSQTEYLAQVSPTLPNARTDHIFTNLLMQHGRKPVEDLDLERKECFYLHGQARRRKLVEDLDLKREKRVRQYGQMSGKQIKHSQDIFLSTDGKHPESVLVTGKAGIGKTLFCQKLIRDWADNKLFQSKANTEVPDFKFAYLLTFRQLNLLGDDPVTLKDILNRSSVLDDHSNIDDSLFEYVVDHPEEVLIVIDGYDECSQRDYIASDSHEKYPNNAFEKIPVAAVCAKLIKGKILRGSVVMITSRPDESDEMKDKDIHFDRYVEITGFSEPQVKEYIGKYFKSNEGMKNTVLGHITKNVNLVSFAHIPVLCFLMCSYFENKLQHSDITNPLPVKTSDLYDEIIKVFVQKHDKNKRLALEVTLDKLSKLAAQLLEERRYLFMKEDLKTFNSQEVESLCGSGLLHCGPPFRKSFSATTKYFCFTHLTLQEYLAASWFVKERKTPPKHVSPEVFQFMSGILSKQKDAVFMEMLLEEISRLRGISVCRYRLLKFKCLMDYEDVEFVKRIVKKRRHDLFEQEGSMLFCYSELTDVDCTTLSFLFHVFGALNAEEESEVSEGTSKMGAKWTLTTLSLSFNQITDAGVVSLCEALQTPTCKLTTLDLRENQITDAGVVSLCQTLQTPTCELTTLDLRGNQITDAGVVSLCQALQTPTCKLTTLHLSGNQITDAGVVSLCQALQTRTCKLTTLHLSCYQIANVDSVIPCRALQTPTSQITDAGFVSLCQALQMPTCKLTTLVLRGNQITDTGVVSLCQALQTPTCKLTTLLLSRNQITDAVT
ncbi:NACHT, LRR and PYD domains-containing protein 12-like [Stylophora pistillata]|uniref:NACHT, LRR and PYD domains-containing protein 12-like n=1 Tax=Stylophora pistillata TaxID=50429 RepID=UPI000C055AC9|nr:NACHT, LRR and PYD domains-containing protein 12-like [Stylophora pistillata]